MTLDLSTSLEPVINLTQVSTSIALARASTYKRVSITIDHIPESSEMVLPIRIIEGMVEIVNRPAVSPKQAFLIGRLFDLMSSSPVLRA